MTEPQRFNKEEKKSDEPWLEIIIGSIVIMFFSSLYYKIGEKLGLFIIIVGVIFAIIGNIYMIISTKNVLSFDIKEKIFLIMIDLLWFPIILSTVIGLYFPHNSVVSYDFLITGSRMIGFLISAILVLINFGTQMSFLGLYKKASTLKYPNFIEKIVLKKRWEIIIVEWVLSIIASVFSSGIMLP